jgi:glutathione-independent formaldehyde dehydrogenase
LGKNPILSTIQTPVMKYHRQLMNAILNDKINIAGWLQMKRISLKDAPRGYAEFGGAAKSL